LVRGSNGDSSTHHEEVMTMQVTIIGRKPRLPKPGECAIAGCGQMATMLVERDGRMAGSCPTHERALRHGRWTNWHRV
jgi:hypothetical protein